MIVIMFIYSDEAPEIFIWIFPAPVAPQLMEVAQ